MFEWISRTKTPLGETWAAINLHIAAMTPQPNIKVVVMMMSTCDCLLPLSPPLLLIPATGGDTKRGEGEVWLLHKLKFGLGLGNFIWHEDTGNITS